MKKLLFFLALASFLQASSILDEYRQNGLDNIEKKLDQALTKPSYWKKLFSKNDISFGYFERYNSVLVCNKEKSTLELYRKNKEGNFVLQKRYTAFTGKNRGEKKSEGDLKTPVGIYNLVQKLSKVDSFYGPMAFVTSYPNLFDKYQNKNGHGIWIHGLPIDQKRDAYTKGCIAIDNQGLKCLDKEIDLHKTVLLIYENATKQHNDPQEFIRLGTWLYKWRNAWKYNDLQSYLSFYSKEFKKANGSDFTAFRNYKEAVFRRNKNKKKSILFNELNIIPYPNHPDIYQITFYERYKSPNYRYNGYKELLVRKKGSEFEIISEN